MAKKTPIKKIDIARWIAVLPAAIIAIAVYSIFILELLYKLLPKFLNEDIVANTVGLINAISLPALIVMSGYYVASKFKFQTALILVLFFLILQTLHIVYNNYDRSNPFIPFYAVSYLISLAFVYKVDKK